MSCIVLRCSSIPLTVTAALVVTEPALHSYTPASFLHTSFIVSRASHPERLAKYLEEFHIRQPSLYHRM